LDVVVEANLSVEEILSEAEAAEEALPGAEVSEDANKTKTFGAFALKVFCISMFC